MNFDIIKGPLLTEKGTDLQERNNQVILRVDRRANKIEIKQAVEQLFRVKVDKIRTCNRNGKERRIGRVTGRTQSWKRAYVSLAEGSKIDFLEGL